VVIHAGSFCVSVWDISQPILFSKQKGETSLRSGAHDIHSMGFYIRCDFYVRFPTNSTSCFECDVESQKSKCVSILPI
jgi:hypothetical protein